MGRRAALRPLPLCHLLFGTLAVASGCARYEPMPLSKDCVDAALSVSPADVARLTPSPDAAGGMLPPAVIDLRDGLNPDEAAAVAVAVNPGLRAERDRLAVSSAQLLQAGILPNPQLTANVDPVTGGNTVDTTTGYSVGLNWEVTALIARDAHVAAASAGRSSVRLDVAWKEWQAAQAARLAVFDLAALREQLARAREVRDRLDEDRRLIRSAVERGQKTIVDLAAAQAASDDARATVLALEREITHQRAALNRALGFPADRDVPVQADVRLPSRLDLPDAPALLDGMEDRRLDLVALRHGYESQESTLRAAVLAQFPKVSLGILPASDTSNVHTFGLGIAVDVPLFDRNQGVIANERATRQQLYDEYVDRVFAARSDVVTALQDVRATNAEIELAAQAIPEQERLVDAYRKALDAGNADVLSYYNAWNELATKRIGLVKLRQQLVQNAVALELASGQFLPALSSSGGGGTAPATQPAATADASVPSEVRP
jgi:outer membrane protein TolC